MITDENKKSCLGWRFAGQTLDWMPTDTKENFESMMIVPKHREYFQNLGWDKPGAITYKFNSHGFRSREFNSSNRCILTLGCSYSFGTGLPVETLWSTLLSQTLEVDCYNLSWPGIASDTCYRLAEYWIPKLKPCAVFVVLPPRHRFELLINDSNDIDRTYKVFMPMSQKNLLNAGQDAYVKNWFLCEDNAEVQQRKNQRAIKNLCWDLNLPCFVENAEKHFADSRDYMHAGPSGHKFLADKFLHDWHEKQQS